MIGDHHAVPESAGFIRAAGAKTRALPSARREAIIFAHGYNNSTAKRLYRFAQMQHDFEVRSTPILYSWSSAASSSDYIYNRDSILFARTGLEALIDKISRTPVECIVIAGHSMGW